MLFCSYCGSIVKGDVNKQFCRLVHVISGQYKDQKPVLCQWK